MDIEIRMREIFELIKAKKFEPLAIFPGIRGIIRDIEKDNEALKTENARLQAIIDEANAQEPVAFEHVAGSITSMLAYGKIPENVFSNASMDRINYEGVHVEIKPLYARPIPAQQSPAVGISKKESTTSSPAVAVPDEIISAINELRKNIRTEGKSVSYCGIRDNDSTRDALEKLFSFNLTQSPRITEQDAREIAQSAVEYYADHRWREGDKFWMHDKGRALLEKLNK